ncbi:pol polyprotein, partial [Pseudoloma neurophilia]
LFVIKSLEHCRHYLLRKQFTLRTDHQALIHMQKSKNHMIRLIPWSLKLKEYDLRIKYIKGSENGADRLRHVRSISVRKEKKRYC